MASEMKDLIQWPTAKYWTTAWNPIVGCKPCSPACENCYAAALAKRFKQQFGPHATTRKNPPRTGVVFCGNMTDLFGEWRSIEDVGADIVKAMKSDPFERRKFTCLWLTKRPKRMCEALAEAKEMTYWPSCDIPILYSNHYFGFTAENQEWHDKRFDEVLNGHWPQWANLWLSAEPLLGPIDLIPFAQALYGLGVPRIFKWVVVGCESGPNRRQCKIEWIESIVEQCRSAEIPVFVKQLDIGGKCVTDIAKFPEHLQIRQVPWTKGAGE